MCHRYHGNTGAGNVKPRDLKIKNRNRKNSIGVGEEATSRGYSTDVVRSSDVSIWKAAGSAEKQMHFPRCLKNPFEEG